MENRETRYIKLNSEKVNLRAQENEEGKKYIIGYAARFNQKSKIITEYVYREGKFKSFYEIIETGAFDQALRENDDIIMTLDHDFGQVLGRTKSGTLKLSVDEIGLRYDLEIPNTQLGNQVFEMVKRGDFYESSFIFTVDENGERWEEDEEGMFIRYISDLSLYEVTVCSYRGAYDNTDVMIAQRKLQEIAERNNSTDDNDNNDDYKIELELDKDKLKLL